MLKLKKKHLKITSKNKFLWTITLDAFGKFCNWNCLKKINKKKQFTTFLLSGSQRSGTCWCRAWIGGGWHTQGSCRWSAACIWTAAPHLWWRTDSPDRGRCRWPAQGAQGGFAPPDRWCVTECRCGQQRAHGSWTAQSKLISHAKRSVSHNRSNLHPHVYYNRV